MNTWKNQRRKERQREFEEEQAREEQARYDKLDPLFAARDLAKVSLVGMLHVEGNISDPQLLSDNLDAYIEAAVELILAERGII